MLKFVSSLFARQSTRAFASSASSVRPALVGRTHIDMALTRKMFQQVPAVNAERKLLGLPPIINLTLGQPHLPVNADVLKRFAAKLQEPEMVTSFGYSQTAGRPETLDAIARLYRHYYPNANYKADEVMVTNGANQALWNAMSILLEEKDGTKDVLLAYVPYFVQYNKQADVLGGVLKPIDTESYGWRPTALALEQTLQRCQEEGDRVKALILNFPNNPSGVMVARDEYARIADVLKKYPEVAIIQDDVYRDISFKPFVSLLDIEPSFKDRTIVINSASKGLIGAPDLRAGMIAAPKDWIGAMMVQQLLSVASISYLSQLALIAGIELKLAGKSEEWEKQMREAYHQNVQSFTQQLNDVGLPVICSAEGAFYLLIDASACLGKEIPDEITLKRADGTAVALKGLREKIGSSTFDSDIALATALIHMAGVATVPSSGFGIDSKRGILRVSCAIDGPSFSRAIENIRGVLEQLQECNITPQPGM